MDFNALGGEPFQIPPNIQEAESPNPATESPNKPDPESPSLRGRVKQASGDCISALNKSQSSSTKGLGYLRAGVKVIFAPVTLLASLVANLFTQIATTIGIGSEEVSKHIDEEKRDKLRAMKGEELTFGSPGKPQYEGMYFKSPYPESPSMKTILVCTGSHASYENYAIPLVENFRIMGHNVMLFNYEGFGKSEGKISEQGVYRSVEAAYQYLKEEKKCSDKSIVGWGYSLGSGAVSDLASKHEVDVVIDRGFASMDEVARTRAPVGFKTLAKVIFYVGARFDNMKKLAKAKGRVLVAQGNADKTMLEKYHGEPLRKMIAAKPGSTYMTVESEHLHGEDVWLDPGGHHQQVKEFLDHHPPHPHL